jgi:metal-responsive CopG/Arc/MetJ family transcriptional regulator
VAAARLLAAAKICRWIMNRSDAISAMIREVLHRERGCERR